MNNIEKIADILGLELEQNQWVSVITDENGNRLEFVDYTDEVIELSDLLTKAQEKAVREFAGSIRKRIEPWDISDAVEIYLQSLDKGEECQE